MTAESFRKRALRIGVDSGGTFTDICLFDEASGRLSVWKVSSTPQDPSEAIAAGIGDGLKATQTGAAAQDVVYFGHGTTVGTNALIQGRGAVTGLVTTEGFRDVLEIRRQKRPELYNLQTRKPPTLVPRDLRVEVRERIGFDGSVITPLDDEDVRRAARRLRDSGVASVAVCTLFSFLHPEHEARIGQILAEEFPEAFVSLSHEIAPEFREFERTSTTVINAYLGPVMQRYLQNLKPRLAKIGMAAEPYLTQSNGGIISAEAAAAQPVRTVLSGPAAGVMGALVVGETAGFGNLITFDMGGTSSDVALIETGRPQFSTESDVHGYPVKVPMLDIHTVGAGGGSIAYVDEGLLKVGPRSAGANPGPVCYGLGNLEPTVTDANVVLGVLNQTHLLNGRMEIDAAASYRAIAGLAERLGIAPLAAAHGIIRVVASNMAKAIRVISVERGYDPRDFTLMAFGGAGPLHAAYLARELDIPRVLVPKYPGIMCALGLLMTDLRTNISQTRYGLLDAEQICGIETAFAALSVRAEAWFAQQGIDPERRALSLAIDLRYGGQGYELGVDWPLTGDPDQRLAELRARFEAQHRQLYGYTVEAEPIQVTTLRIEALGRVEKARLEAQPPAQGPVSAAVIASRELYDPDSGMHRPCPVYSRERLGPGHRIDGPAIIEQMDSTTLLLSGQSAAVDPYLNILIEG